MKSGVSYSVTTLRASGKNMGDECLNVAFCHFDCGFFHTQTQVRKKGDGSPMVAQLILHL
jgi:hypothetical protein